MGSFPSKSAYNTQETQPIETEINTYNPLLPIETAINTDNPSLPIETTINTDNPSLSIATEITVYERQEKEAEERETEENRQDINMLVEDLEVWSRNNNSLYQELSENILTAFKNNKYFLSLNCKKDIVDESGTIIREEKIDTLPPHIFNSSIFKYLEDIEILGAESILDSDSQKVKIHLDNDYKLCNNTTKTQDYFSKKYLDDEIDEAENLGFYNNNDMDMGIISVSLLIIVKEHYEIANFIGTNADTASPTIYPAKYNQLNHSNSQHSHD